jgi:hypothetical protein
MAISELTKLRIRRAMNDPTAATEAVNAVNAANTYVEGVTAGTVTASKALIVDSSSALDTLTVASLPAPAVAAEHGAGAVGTGVAPVTYRRTENGIIITEIKIDIKGFASVSTANDVIGKTGAAYIGRYVTATNGIIFKIEMICVQVPATGDTDINVVANSSAVLAADGAGGEAYGVNAGTWTAGKVVENLVQGLTANHYFYLTQGGTTAGTYTSGQFIIRLHGHPVLT